MPGNNRIITLVVGSLIIPLLLIAGLGWANYHLVKAFPDQVGNRFEIQWQAIRQFAKTGSSPYPSYVSSSVTAPGTGSQKVGFTSPLYSVIFILPFTLINDLQVAKSIWMVILEGALILSALMIFRLVAWKPGKLQFAAFIVFTLFGFQSVQSLIAGETTILSVFFSILGLNALRDKRMEQAGFLFALATIQPRMVVLGLLFAVLWAASRRNWKFLIWFLGSLAVLIFFALIFIPDWPLQYLRVIWHIRDFYPILIPSTTLKASMPGIGRQIGIGVSILVGLALLIEWILARKKEFNWFLWTACLTLILSPWTGVPYNSQDFVFYLLPMGLILGAWDQRMAILGKGLGLLLMLALFIGEWWIFFKVPSQSSFIQLQAPYLFLLPLIFLLLIYWVRWWAIHSYRSILADLRSSKI